MMGKELQNWVEDHKKQGFSDEQLEQTLKEHGHDEHTITNVLGKISMPLALYLTVLIGLGTFCFILAGLSLLVSSFLGLGQFIPLVIILLCGLLSSLVIHITSKEGKMSATQEVLLAILAPICTTYLLYYVLVVAQKLSMQLELFGSTGVGSGLSAIFSFDLPHALGSAILFYIAANLFTIVDLVKRKQRKALMWYILALALLVLMWVLGVLFATPISSF